MATIKTVLIVVKIVEANLDPTISLLVVGVAKTMGMPHPQSENDEDVEDTD